ncbi:unnamed protein product [Rotaria socialis]
MQTDSISLDTLKNKLLCAVDGEYNVLKPETVLDIICQLEKMEITKDQLQATRLGREINTIRQKLDARKKTISSTETYPELIIEITQRAKKLLRSWQGLLNVSQTDVSSNTLSSTNGDTKPRLILRVKLNSPVKKRKHESDSDIVNGGTNAKRKKTQVLQTPTPISPALLTETNGSLPRLKTTQQILMEMQKNEPHVLSTETSTVHAILQKRIIDESLNEPAKIDYSALHHGRDLINMNTNSIQYSRKISSPNNPIVKSGSSSKLQSLIHRSSSTLIPANSNWENGSSAGSPISPLSSSSSSSIISTHSWPVSTIIPEPSLTVSIVPKKKRQKKDDDSDNDQQLCEPSNIEQSTTFTSDLATMCASYNKVADLVEDHRRRIIAKYESRELEARPDLLLVPIDQLAFVYEREQSNELNLPIETTHSSMTKVEKFTLPFDLIALPFIDCPLEFDLVLDELVVQNPIMDIDQKISEMNETSYFDKLKKKALTKSIEPINEGHHKSSPAKDLRIAKDIQKQSAAISNIYHCQTGILTPFNPYEHGLYIILHLTNEYDNDIRDACRKLPQIKESLSQLHPGCRLEATLGIGYSKTQEWLARADISFPKVFIEFQEKNSSTGKTMPCTGGDLMLHIRSDRKDLCFELGQQFCQSIPDDCIIELDETFGFSYMSSQTNGLSQDLTGFEDGNENPKGDELRAKAALICEGDDVPIHIGGSFALTQKWKHNLNQWARLSQAEQENVIGRTKGEESKKIRPKISTSHISRTDLKENGVDIKVVRQSLPYGGMKEHGLFFISYASNPNKHERQLNSMIGMDDGIYDRIMDFSTPITGNYWFIPSIDVYEKMF